MARQWASGSLCIQIAIDKIKLCSLSVVYACPYHNPTTTMGHSVHISKPLTLDAIHVVCHLPGTVESGIQPQRAHFSSVPVVIEGEHLLTEVGNDTDLQ